MNGNWSNQKPNPALKTKSIEMSDFVGIPSYFFCKISLISDVSINIYDYVN